MFAAKNTTKVSLHHAVIEKNLHEDQEKNKGKTACWPDCLAFFSTRLSAQQYRTWIAPLRCQQIDRTLFVLAPNQFSLQFIKTRYLDDFSAYVRTHLGEDFQIHFQLTAEDHGPASELPMDERHAMDSPAKPAAAHATSENVEKQTCPIGEANQAKITEDSSLPGASRTSRKQTPQNVPHPQLSASSQILPLQPAEKPIPQLSPLLQPVVSPQGSANSAQEQARLDPSLRFDTLVSGKANQVSLAIAQQVADNPESRYNPLFVYGNSGVGKTHLVQAIGNAVLIRNPRARIRYIQAGSYVSDVLKAYQHKAFDEFRRYYHSLDLLIMDDIQHISGNKERTQEEFFYLFNILLENQRRIILTSDRLPREIVGMDERLVSRFGGGITTTIDPPETEMRVAILCKKAEQEAVQLDHAVALFIAKHIRSNVRELEGGLKRVLAHARFTNQAVTVKLAREALQDLLAASSKQVSIDNIQKTVADYYKTKVVEMHSKKRSRDIVRPRQMAMALTKNLTQMSLPAIGEAFGGRDHTTVLHACRVIEKLRQGDITLNHDYNLLRQMLRS